MTTYSISRLTHWKHDAKATEAKSRLPTTYYQLLNCCIFSYDKMKCQERIKSSNWLVQILFDDKLHFTINITSLVVRLIQHTVVTLTVLTKDSNKLQHEWKRRRRMYFRWNVRLACRRRYHIEVRWRILARRSFVYSRKNFSDIQEPAQRQWRRGHSNEWSLKGRLDWDSTRALSWNAHLLSQTNTYYL